MNIGMLWYDDDPKRPLDDKVQRAADYYRQKYGELATVCYLNAGQLNGAGNPTHAGGIRLQASRTVMPHHFWLGVAEPEKSAA